MGSGPIGTATDGTVIPSTDHNSIKEALIGDQVPRNASGTAVANAGGLGTTTFPYTDAKITAGYFSAGVIMTFHDFNGAISLPQGWVRCTGQLINEVNYDAVHGVGSWAQFVGTSPLDGKFTPNMLNRYFVGSNSTPQDGSVAITSVGNTGSQITTSNHSHVVNSHNHQFLESNGNGAVSDQTYDVNGNLINYESVTTKTGSARTISSVFGPDNDYFTSNATPGTSSNGSEVISIKPESIEVQYIIRII